MKQQEAFDDIHDRPTDPTGETLTLEAESEAWTEARSGVRPRPQLQRAPWLDWRAFGAGELVIGLVLSGGLFCFGTKVTAVAMGVITAFCLGSLTAGRR